jgi:hypothetical protein
MLLQLDSKHRVTVDSSCQNYQLEQLREVKNKKTDEIKLEWNNIGFHGLSLRSVLHQYKNNAIAVSKLETINDVLDRLNEIDRTIEKVVNQVKDIKLVVAKND